MKLSLHPSCSNGAILHIKLLNSVINLHIHPVEQIISNRCDFQRSYISFIIETANFISYVSEQSRIFIMLNKCWNISLECDFF